MRGTILLPVMIAAGLLAVPMRFSVAAEDAWGRWQNDDGSNVYEFLVNNQFRFSGIQKVWVQQQGFAGSPFANIPRSNATRGQYVQERKDFSGAWETGQNICAVTLPSRGKVTGNLKLYVGTAQCCMEAKRLGPTLVLRAIRDDEDPALKHRATKDEGLDVCVGRALRQSNEEAK
jgi:hypothetical protein